MIKAIILLLIFKLSTLQATEYDLFIKGIKAGTIIMDIKPINYNSNNYRVKLSISLSWIAKLFGAKNMIETSRGVFKSNHFYPVYYQRKELNGKVLFSIDFNKRYGTNKKGQDPLSQIIQIRYDLIRKEIKPYYNLITEKSEQRYIAKIFATKNGNKVILKQSPSKERIITLWFNKKNNLDRMQKEKRGKINFNMIKK